MGYIEVRHSLLYYGLLILAIALEVTLIRKLNPIHLHMYCNETFLTWSPLGH